MFSLREASARARESEVAAVVDAVERYLQSESGARKFRQARGCAEATVDIAAYRGLESLGLTSAFIPERLGGSGLAPGVGALIGDRLGWALAGEPFVENVVLPSLLLNELHADELATVGDSPEIDCVAWQEGAFSMPKLGEVRTVAKRDGGALRVRGTKRFVMGARASTRMLVLASMDDEPAIVCIPSAAPGVSRKDMPLADGTWWSTVDFDVSLDNPVVAGSGPGCIAALWSALSGANLALAGALYGLQSRILAMTLDYLGTRVQFDRPIGAFQALQHRAVDLYNQVQIARFLLGEAIDAADGAMTPQVRAYASRAKARAAEAALRVAKEGIQMHGAIGFSDEHDLGLYAKRVLVLSAWLGNADWHRQAVARQLGRGMGAEIA